MSRSFLDHYEDQIKANLITPDPAQAAMAKALNRLEQDLSGYSPAAQNLWSKLLKRGPASPVPKGLYLWGGVGRGKTMLMDLFYDYIRFAPKTRCHFNEFMATAHKEIAQARKTHEGDPIPHVASGLANTAKLICFDEFYVTDITDAMLLGRLFTTLFEEGVVIVATSNCPIHELYKEGLNRQLFLPFIHLFQDQMISHEIISETDHRHRRLFGKEHYYTPLGEESDQAVCRIWLTVTGKAEGKPAKIIVNGRTLMVPEQAAGAARFKFSDLCAAALGRDDYLALAARYHTLFIDDIPKMQSQHRNEARRFITLIDTLYDQGIRLIATAEAEPNELYQAGDNKNLFHRTQSRLTEMRHAAHLSEPIMHKNQASAL